jgi:ATP-binding cassette, subfamily C, bacterial
VIFFLLKGLRNQALHLGQRMSQAERAMMGNVQESLAGIKLAKILGTEQSYLHNFTAYLKAVRDENLSFQINQTRASAWYQITGALLLACFLYLGIKVLNTPMATLLTLVFIFSRLLPMFSNTQVQYQYWLHALPSVQRCYQLIAAAEAQAEPACDVRTALTRVEDSIELIDARVCYTGRQDAALDAVTLTLKSRTTTAVMGESGAGKSTLADVLMGLLDLDSGHLLVDGRRIDGADLLSWRHSVSYVPQDNFLFHDSIRRNLLWGDLQADDEDLERALRQAAADFVFDLPNGMDTLVGDGGALLSGGERQRIALARALLKKPALLILDEATSALDTANEARIRQAIENLHGDLTVLIIGHRLPTLEHADQVIVMAQGRIKARGSWQDVAAHL